MSRFGYQIARIAVTPRYKTGEDAELSFENPQFGSGGLRALLVSECLTIREASGEADDRDLRYFRLDSVHEGGWVCAVEASGGSYGEYGEVVNVRTKQRSAQLGNEDAVLRSMKMLLLVPPTGKAGLLIAQTKGNSHLATPLVRALIRRLQEQNMTLRIERDVADEVAWSEFLEQGDVGIQALELVQHGLSPSGNTLGDSRRVEKAVLSLKLNKAAGNSASLFGRLRDAIAAHKPINLDGIVGTSLTSEDFDEQRVVYVQDGHERRIRVSQSWPRFTYELESDEPPAFADLLAQSRSAVETTLAHLGIDRQDGWWPSDKALREL